MRESSCEIQSFQKGLSAIIVPDSVADREVPPCLAGLLLHYPKNCPPAVELQPFKVVRGPINLAILHTRPTFLLSTFYHVIHGIYPCLEVDCRRLATKFACALDSIEANCATVLAPRVAVADTPALSAVWGSSLMLRLPSVGIVAICPMFLAPWTAPEQQVRTSGSAPPRCKHFSATKTSLPLSALSVLQRQPHGSGVRLAPFDRGLRGPYLRSGRRRSQASRRRHPNDARLE